MGSRSRTALLAAAAAAALLGACGTTAQRPWLNSDIDVPTRDGGPDPAAGEDGPVAEPDEAPGDDGPADPGADDAAEAGPDVPGDDFMSACESNKDCASAFCVNMLGGRKCTKTCTAGSCPDPLECLAVRAQDGHEVRLCLPPTALLCQPCATHQDCRGGLASLDGAGCVPRGGDGSFCGTPCKALGDCPANYECRNTGDPDLPFQCMPKGGDCPCTALSVTLALETPCAAENPFGRCAGVRRCEGQWPSACDAVVPGPEKCDGVDDDCDGQSDEGSCDDRESCTRDDCLPADGGGYECRFAPLTGPLCDDEDACTLGDACTDGACVPGGEAPDCDDGNACTADWCVAATGCMHAAAPGPCDDADPCTAGDHCAAGACVGSEVPGCCREDAQCDDADPCTVDSCAKATGDCVHDAPLANGTPCDADADPCTVGDACLAGACLPGPAADCSAAADACNDAACVADRAGGYACVPVPVSAGRLCDDGRWCTTADACDGDGTCEGGPEADCSGLNGPCVTGWCDEDADRCAAAPKTDGTPCPDADGCTPGDWCLGGACQKGTPADCSGVADACNDGVCQSTGPDSFTCRKKPKKAGTACEDGQFCTTPDTCNAKGECTGGPPRACPAQADPCAAAACDDDADACVAEPKPEGASCEDGDACTAGDSCRTGACAGTDTCAEVRADTFAAPAATAPAIARLGGGRFDVAFAAEPGGLADRAFDASWSREGDEALLVAGSPVVGIVQAPFRDGVARARALATETCTGDTCSVWRVVEVAHLGADLVQTWGASFPLLATAGDYSPTPAIATGGGVTAACWRNGTPARIDCMARPDGEDALHHATVLSNASEPAVAALSDGRIVVAAVRETDVWIQFLSSTLAPEKPAWRVNKPMTGLHKEPALTVAGGDRVVVLWTAADADGLGVFGKVVGPTGTPMWGEFAVNPTTAGDQSRPKAVTLTDGSFVVAWASQPTGGAAEVRAQRFGPPSTGVSKAGAELVVPRRASGVQAGPALAAFPAARWAAAWVASGGVWVRGFESTGQAWVGAPELRVEAVLAGDQSGARVAAGGGGAVVAWESPFADGNGTGVLVRRFTPAGAYAGQPFVANTHTAGDQGAPAVGAALDGRFVIAWESLGQDGDGKGVFAQRFDASGGRSGPEILVPASVVNDQEAPDVAVSALGALAVAFESYGQEGGVGLDVFVRCWDATGKAIFAERIVNSSTGGTQARPRIAALWDGRYVVAWQSETAAGIDVLARVVGSDCVPGTEATVSHGGLDATSPDVAASPDGRFAVAWQAGAEGDASIIARVFTGGGVPDGSSFPIASAAGGKGRTRPAVAFLSAASLYAAWESDGDDGSGKAVRAAAFDPEGVPLGPAVILDRVVAGDQVAPDVAVLGSGRP
ncbi:MAG: hypothetical protein FJ087_04945, partial [Deltaproteobacteria bacterium]|nr:hypothetical protein [Deltaproteobacteria bacterium]